MCIHNHKSPSSSSSSPFEFSAPNELDYPLCDYLDSENLDYLSPHVSDLRIMHINIRGLISKQTELDTVICNGYGPAKLIDIVLLNETWLQKETIKKVSIPGYTLHSKERIGRKGGGIGILVSNSLKCRPRPDLYIESEKLEHLVVEIKTQTTSLLFAPAYRPPNVDAKLFINDYSKLINCLSKDNLKSGGLIIGLDHNMDLLKYRSHKLTQDFLDMNYDKKHLPYH